MTNFITIAVTIPALLGHPDKTHSWSESATLDELIAARDPFQFPSDERNVMACGPTRPLDSIRPYFQSFMPALPEESEPWYRINDDVVLSYWESRNGESYWTPLTCGDSYRAAR
jgi:hypothetical protein